MDTTTTATLTTTTTTAATATFFYFVTDSVSSEVKSNSFVQSYNIFPDNNNNNNNNDFVEVEDDDEQQLSPRLDDEAGDDLIVREVVDPYDLFDNLQFGGNCLKQNIFLTTFLSNCFKVLWKNFEI